MRLFSRLEIEWVNFLDREEWGFWVFFGRGLGLLKYSGGGKRTRERIM